MTSVSPTESQVIAALRTVLLNVLPGIGVYHAQDNRVPEPDETNFILLTPTGRTRLTTNIDDYIDTFYTGSITGTTLTVTSIVYGHIAVGSPVFGVNVADGTSVNALGSGSGGVGTYIVNNAQTVASGALASGLAEITQEVDLVIQCDVHGDSSSGDNALAISTILRDTYAAGLFEQILGDGICDPLYADDPKQVPFINDQNQFENRWIVEAHIQVNQTLNVGQQFADAVTVGLINVDATYPP